MTRAVVFNWGLLACAAVLVGLVMRTANTTTSGEALVRQQHLIQSFDPEGVTRLQREGDDPVELVREGQWRLRRPVASDAEAATVDQLLRHLRFSTWLRQVDMQGISRDSLGLEQPRWVWHVDIGDARYRLRLGKPTESPKGAAYLEVTGENTPKKGVFVVTDSVVTDLAVPAQDFRVRRLVPLPEADVAELSLSSKGETLRLSQPARNDWRFVDRFAGARLD